MCITLAIVREIELASAFWNHLLINGIVNGIFSFGTFHNFRHNMPNNELKARKAFEWLTKVDGRERKLGGDMDRVKDIVMTYRPNKIMSLAVMKPPCLSAIWLNQVSTCSHVRVGPRFTCK